MCLALSPGLRGSESFIKQACSFCIGQPGSLTYYCLGQDLSEHFFDVRQHDQDELLGLENILYSHEASAFVALFLLSEASQVSVHRVETSEGKSVDGPRPDLQRCFRAPDAN